MKTKSNTQNSADKSALWKLSGTFFFIFSSFGIFSPYVPVFLESVGMQKYQIGMITMIPNLCAFTVGPLFTFLADSYNIQHQMLLASVLVPTIATLFVPLFTSFSQQLAIHWTFSILRASEVPLLDSTTLSLLSDTADYGTMRLWGAIGFGIFSFLGGYILSFAENAAKIRYYFSYSVIIQALFHFIAGIIINSLAKQKGYNLLNTNEAANDAFADGDKQAGNDSSDPDTISPLQSPELLSNDQNDSIDPKIAPTKNVMKSLVHIFNSQPGARVFAIVILLSGLGSGIIDSFLFLRLRELNGTGMVMGLARFITCAAEVPLFQASGWLQHRLGIWPLIAITQVCFVIRFAYYANLENPWYVLPCEVLHGFTFAITWSVACNFGSIIATPDSRATVQALLDSLHFGLGSALGSFLGGMVYDKYGAVWLFQVSGGVSAFSALVAICGCLVFNHPTATPPMDCHPCYTGVSTDIQNQSMHTGDQTVHDGTIELKSVKHTSDSNQVTTLVESGIELA